jgi:hypothetical protein
MRIVKDPMTPTLQIYTFQNPLSESLLIIKDFLVVSRPMVWEVSTKQTNYLPP